jgi:hypothetical protein
MTSSAEKSMPLLDTPMGLELALSWGGEMHSKRQEGIVVLARLVTLVPNLQIDPLTKLLPSTITKVPPSRGPTIG